MKKKPNFLIRSMLLLIPPCVELIALRYAINLDIAFPVETAVEIILLLFLGFLWFAEHEGAQFAYGLRKKSLTLNLAAFLGAYFLAQPVYLSRFLNHFDAQTYLFLLLILSAGALFSSLFIFVSLRSFWLHLRRHPRLVWTCIGIGALFFLYKMLNLKIWYGFLAQPTTEAVRSVLDFFGVDQIKAIGTFLSHPLYKVRIDYGCSGFEGILFFMITYVILRVRNAIHGSAVQDAAAFTFGIFYMWGLNVMRISVFFAFALWTKYHYGTSDTARLTRWFFHGNVGWVLYFVGISLFFMAFFQIQKVYLDKAKREG